MAHLVQSDRLAHTVLIEGRQGSGKKTFASHLAAAYLCATPQADGLPCGSCLDCRLAIAGKHPDLEHISGEATSKNGAITVEMVREMKLRAQKKPNQARRRGFILLDCHLMQGPAQNALLKQIEEPAGSVFYILLADNAHTLLETIRSRAFLMHMAELTIPACVAAVRTLLPQVDPEKIERVASLMGTSVGSIVEALGDAGSETLFDECTQIYTAIVNKNRYGMMSCLLKHETNRKKYLSLLYLLKQIVISRAGSHNPDFSYGQTAAIADIIDYAGKVCNQNVVLPLLSCVLASELVGCIT